jgi:hypothetical protein
MKGGLRGFKGIKFVYDIIQLPDFGKPFKN